MICFFLFYFQTQKLFARYFIAFTQLRFFNNYLHKKTVLIYEFIDNNQKNSKAKELLFKLEFENDLEQVSTIKYIMSDKIEHFKQIKVKSLSIKYKIPFHDIIRVPEEINTNKNETIIASLIKGTTFKNINNINKNHYSVSNPTISKRISNIEQKGKIVKV